MAMSLVEIPHTFDNDKLGWIKEYIRKFGIVSKDEFGRPSVSFCITNRPGNTRPSVEHVSDLPPLLT